MTSAASDGISRLLLFLRPFVSFVSVRMRWWAHVSPLAERRNMWKAPRLGSRSLGRLGNPTEKGLSTSGERESQSESVYGPSFSDGKPNSLCEGST